MDDHMYEKMLDYAEIELIPRFREEYQTFGKIKDCPSYDEMKALCTALNAVAPYAGYSHVTPSDFIPVGWL